MEYGTPVVYNIGEGSGNGGGGNCGGGMWGGDGSWIFAFLIIALIFGDRLGLGGNGNSGGSNGGGDSMAAFLPYLAGNLSSGGGAATQGALTREQACIDNNFQNLMRETAGIADSVAVGFANLNSTICNQQYDTAQMVNGLSNTVQQGFNAANVVALTNQNALQTQLAQCCCNLERGIDGVNFNMAQNACALQNTIQSGFRDSIDATNAGTRAILDFLCQEKIADLQSENQGLRLAASQAQQNQYLISQLRPQPVPAYPATSPCGLGNWSPAVLANGWGGYNGGCGGCCGF